MLKEITEMSWLFKQPPSQRLMLSMMFKTLSLFLILYIHRKCRILWFSMRSLTSKILLIFKISLKSTRIQLRLVIKMHSCTWIFNRKFKAQISTNLIKKKIFIKCAQIWIALIKNWKICILLKKKKEKKKKHCNKVKLLVRLLMRA